jgi:hypothetical protein
LGIYQRRPLDRDDPQQLFDAEKVIFKEKIKPALKPRGFSAGQQESAFRLRMKRASGLTKQAIRNV